MQALCVGATVRPVGLVRRGAGNDLPRQRDRITTRASRAEDDLERLESFFGSGDGYTARRHHRRGHWVEDEYVHVPVDEAEAPIAEEAAAAHAPEQAAPPAPEQTAPPAETRASALDQLSQITSEQLANLQAASQHAADALRDQTGRLASAVQHQAEETQAALSRTADSLKQRMTTGRTASTAPPAAPVAAPAPVASQRNEKAAPAPATSQKSQKTSSTTATPAAEAAAPSIRERFKTEVHHGLDSLRSLSTQQLQNLEAAVHSVRSGVASRAGKLQAMVARRAPEAAAPPAQQQKTQQRPVKQQIVKKKDAAVPTAEAQSAINWAAALRERLPSVSVPAPLAALPSEAERLGAALAANPWVIAVGGAALALAALRWAALSSKQRDQLAEQEALSRARSRRALDRQRARFKQALDGSEDDNDAAGIDSSVFAAVKQIRTTAAAASAAAAATAAAGEFDEDGDADVAAMDPELRRQWEAFVKGSRLSDAEMWDPEEVDEGLPEVYIEFENEDEE